MNHFISKCKHGVIQAQCRCIDPNKEQRLAETCNCPAPATLMEGEYHPAADNAKTYLNKALLLKWAEPLASTALSGNRLSEICYETLDRLLKDQPVSDRYLLGLAWTIRNLEGGE